jgi:hypothetical protein
MEILVLETLKETVNLFSSIKCDFFVENCIVVLKNHNYATGCLLRVTGDYKTHFKLEWSSRVNMSSYGGDKTETDVTEHAAEAIVFFLTHKLTPYQVIRKAAKDTGFDYWLCYDENHSSYNAKNFLNARLEISGIFKEDKGKTEKNANRQKRLYATASLHCGS